jgi:hypothetical protein
VLVLESGRRWAILHEAAADAAAFFFYTSALLSCAALEERQMNEEALIQALESGEIPPGGLPHADHVRLAWYCLRQQPLLTALSRVRHVLQCAAAAAGRPERYHETVTVGFVLLIAERLAGARELSWDVFAVRNPDLLAWTPSLLARFYTEETLASERSRTVFVMPDRDQR